MTMSSIVVISLIVAGITYIIGIIGIIIFNRKNDIRIEVAKQNNWVTIANRIDSKIVNVATGRDYRENKPRLMYKGTYEYELNGVKKKLKQSSYSSLPSEIDLYYDPENGYQILNGRGQMFARYFILIPVIVFIALALLLKTICNV